MKRNVSTISIGMYTFRDCFEGSAVPSFATGPNQSRRSEAIAVEDQERRREHVFIKVIFRQLQPELIRSG
jgi:hypothetical protein